MKLDAPTIGRGALAGAALAASACPLSVQLGFAVLAIGVVGMAHGASDLSIVPVARRREFLLLYIAALAACLLWWTLSPELALPFFLIASAVHFGIEDASRGASLERIARGVGLVAIPATLHGGALDHLFGLAGGYVAVPDEVIGSIATAGALSCSMLIVLAVLREDARLAAGTMSLLLLPPLVGFSVGFLVLHALPQTLERRLRLGCATLGAYLVHVAAPLVTAMALVGVIGMLMLEQDASGVRSLFAAIAALAMPHLVVTPMFERTLGDRSAARTC